MAEVLLEERAKELLKWKITKEGKRPNLSTDSNKRGNELSYLLERGYVIRSGETPKCLYYSVTEAGRRWALQK